MKYVVDKIGEVVDLMRKTGNFIVSDQTGEVYTLSGNNELKESEWVVISGNEYKVYDVTSTSFKITTPNVIVAGSYKTLAPYYMYGHRLEINNRLLEKTQDSKYKYQKYPLVALRLPIPELELNSVVSEVELNVGIITSTENNYNADQRYENVFKPILYPLYDLFLVKLKKSYTFLYRSLVPNHKKIDRLFFGTQGTEGNERHIFTDPIDAIEITDLRLNINNNC